MKHSAVAHVSFPVTSPLLPSIAFLSLSSTSGYLPIVFPVLRLAYWMFHEFLFFFLKKRALSIWRTLIKYKDEFTWELVRQKLVSPNMLLLQKKNILKFNRIPSTVESVQARVEMQVRTKKEWPRDSRLSEGELLAIMLKALGQTQIKKGLYAIFKGAVTWFKGFTAVNHKSFHLASS